MEENKAKSISQNNKIFNDDLSLIELLKVIWNKKIILLIFVAIGLFFGLIFGFLMNMNNAKVSTIVEMQWDGISKGEYPDGQRFDYGSAINANIYGLVIEEMGLDITINELQKHFFISPITPSNILEIAKNAELENVDYRYYPTSFTFTVNSGKLGFTKEQAKTIIMKIVDNFRSDFERKYIAKSIIFSYSSQDLSQYDYMEVVEILSENSQMIKNSVSKAISNGGNFFSSDLGFSFSDIVVRVDLFSKINLTNMETRVNSYLLSKDTDFLIAIYEYRIEQIEFDLAEQESIKNELQLLINDYVGGTSTIIIPGIAMEDQVMVEPYLNTLYSKMVDTQTKIASYEQDIAYYTLRVNRLSGNDPAFILTPATIEEETLKIENQIIEASIILESISRDSENILKEFNLYISRGIIKSIVPPQDNTRNMLILYGAIGLLAGTAIGLAVIFVKRYKITESVES